MKISPHKLRKDILAVLVEKIQNLKIYLNVHTDYNIPRPSGMFAPCRDSSVVNVPSAPSIPSETKRTRSGKRQSIKGKGKSKKSKTSDESDESCGICNKTGKDEDF